MASPVYRFGPFTLEPASRRLLRGAEEVPLHRKAFDCIVYLVEHRDRAVERDELLGAVWGDVHLSDSALGQAIFEARRAVDDTGQEQRVIRTMWGFGYRWVAPVETVNAFDEDPVEPHVEARPGPGRRPVWLAMLLALLVVGALTGGTVYLARDGTRGDGDRGAPEVPDEGTIALLLPVTVAADDERFAWIRLGVMDLIGQRLRAAGQPVVPSDSVIALLRGSPEEPGPEELENLAARTGARLVLRPRATAAGDRWRISLRSVRGLQPPLKARAEAPDVLDAARLAADRIALSLGLTPAPEPAAEPGLTTLLQRTKAAVLALQHDVARELLEQADAELRRHPKVRLQRAYIELHSHNLDEAQAILESLLPEVPAARDPLLRARVLHHLGWVHKYRADPTAAESVLAEAASLFAGGGSPPAGDAAPLLGRIRSTLGTVALHRGDLEGARRHFAHARVLLQGTGDALGLAALGGHMGLLAARRERYAEALAHFERSVEQAAARHDLANELGELANVVWMHLGLLDPPAALALDARLRALLPRADNPLIAATGKLARAMLLDANGRRREAARILDEFLTSVETGDMRRLQLLAQTLRAEQVAREGDFVRSKRMAMEVVEQVPPGDARMAEERARAWLILVRAHLELGRSASAAEEAAAMAQWVAQADALPPRLYTTLAAAEVAAAQRDVEGAETAYERALALADTSQVPLRSLQVAESYVPWLLAVGSDGTPSPERALVVANRVAGYADRHYRAALLQLRVARALGIPSAWRIALASARSLAGERRIPEELLEVPPTPLEATRG